MRTRPLGFALVVLGATTPAQSLLYRNDGEHVGGGMGFAVGALRDVDGDGVDDYLLGEFHVAGGFTYMMSGRTGTAITTLTGLGCFGMAFEDLGDPTGDGLSEYAVGAPRLGTPTAPSAGTVHVFDGGSHTELYRVHGESANERFGISIDAVGDVDLDGFVDYAVGSPRDSTLAHESGSATLLSGVDGGELFEWRGGTARDWLGIEVAGIGDRDLDGWADVLVGAPVRWYTPTVSPANGYARIYSGKDGAERGSVTVYDGATLAVVRTLQGEPLSRYGTSVRPADDLDGDGTTDLVAGACYCTNLGPQSAGLGFARVSSGADGATLA